MAYKSIEERREYERRWYAANKERKREINDAWRERRVSDFKLFKTLLSCSKCGESDPRCLDFHHRDPTTKSSDVATAIRRFGKVKFKEEVEKCDVLCANCHRKLPVL